MVPVRYGTAAGRWVIAAAVLGSGVAFLDATVVNVALPAIGRDLHAGFSGLQWTLDAYLLSLGSLLLVGGSLGDLFGRRRVFVIGLVGFTASSVLCGAAPTIATLVVARAVQGAAAALLVPGSLALLSASFHPDDRARAVGAWSGLAGVWTAVGPFLGGWLIGAVSWRLVFFVNLPVAAFAAWVALHHVPESLDEDADRHVDVLGAVAVTAGLGGAVYALIEGPVHGVSVAIVAMALVSAAALVLFVVVELRSPHPMVPMSLFRSRQFSAANATTFAVYAALGIAMFLLVLELQKVLAYSPLEAGASLLPVTLLLLLLSSRTGALAQRIGPRLPMTLGPVVAAAGLALLARVGPGTTYVGAVLPGVVVLGVGLALTVAPLTAAVLAAIDEHHVGVGSAINNATARVSGLVAVALVPAVSGLAGAHVGLGAFTTGFHRAMWIGAGLCAAGGVISLVGIRRAADVSCVPHADIGSACHSPDLQRAAAAA